MKPPFVVKRILPTVLLLLVAAAIAIAQGNTATTRTNNPDGSTTVTTTTTYKDGSTTTTTNYDKDGNDAGTTRTDVQTKDGETTTTTTKYDGSGHETGRTVERVDKNGNKTTTTYDGQGHQIITTVRPAAPKTAPKNAQASLKGIVVPDDVHDQQPFTFAVPQGSGPVSIQRVDGVVVESRPPDKLGRVFMPAGLPAGSYLISRIGSGSGTEEAGKIEIQTRLIDVLYRPSDRPNQPVQIEFPPQTVKVGDPLWLSGHGFSPNCSEMQASLLASGQTHDLPVLAATEDQLKLAPITEMKPGAAELKITNQSTHQSAPALPLFFYDLQGRLQQHKLRSGQETTVVFEALPANVKMTLHASISGKATFSGGRTEIDAVIEHGRLTVPVEADKGVGDFHIDFEGQPENLPQRAGCACGCGGTAQPACAHKGCSCSNASLASASSAESPERSACSCGCGGTAQPACAHKGCACSKAMAAAAKAQASCTCGCGGTAQPACAHKGCACSKASATSALPVSLQPRLEHVSAPPAKSTGKASCKCGCGGTAQPRCVQKECGCGK
jgi:YD repeat-containing protein